MVEENSNMLLGVGVKPPALVTMVEHVGNHKVLSEIIGRNLIEDQGLGDAGDRVYSTK